MTEKRRYSVAFIPRVTQVYDKEKDKQLSSFELDDLLLKFEKEKNELKEELRIYRQVANCHNCEYHDYDWFDYGDEFEVCRKGNDVSEGICKDWEEL